MITVEKFIDSDTQDVIDLVLHFQNDGSRPFVSVDDQPDLLHITEEYINKGGYFWVAKDDGKLAGTVGIIPYTDDVYVLKKFFVYEMYQGHPLHLGQKLFSLLLEFAKKKGAKKILLDTPRNTVRAHKFYERAGFKKVEREAVPVKYKTPYEECDYFILEV